MEVKIALINLAKVATHKIVQVNNKLLLYVVHQKVRANIENLVSLRRTAHWLR